MTDRQKRQSAAGVGVAIGAGVGVALGVALDNIAVGVAVGVGVGAALGAALKWPTASPANGTLRTRMSRLAPPVSQR